MLCVKLFFVIAVILCLLPKESQVTGIFALAYHLKQCSHYENTVYTIGGNECHIFRNPCFVKKYIRDQRNTNKPCLSLTTKAGCQAICPKDCGTKKNPVCGEYAGLYAPYENDCELRRAACVNGLSIIKVPISKCSYSG